MFALAANRSVVPAGTWTGWLTATQQIAAVFDLGQDGHAYAFRSRAGDHVGNVEEWPVDPDAMTTVDTMPPETAVDTLPLDNARCRAVSRQPAWCQPEPVDVSSLRSHLVDEDEAQVIAALTTASVENDPLRSAAGWVV